MRPILFRLLGLEVPAYFAMLAIGFALATWVGARWLGKLGYDREVVIDLGLASVIAGVLGARILHVLADGYFWDYVHLCTDPARVSWRITRGHCLDPSVNGVWDGVANVCHPRERNCFAWAAFWAGGLTYYGGLIAAAAYSVYFLRRERFPFWKAADMAGFAIALGLAWGRMGCFLAGCCFGTRCELPFAARFPGWSPASEAHYKQHLLRSEALPALPVHPTQLYEALGCVLIAALTYGVVAPRKRYDGQMFVVFLGAYAILRAAVEVLRDDDRGGFLGLSTSQLISLGIVVALVPLTLHLRKRSPRSRKDDARPTAG